jgi:hypothetical protein
LVEILSLPKLAHETDVIFSARIRGLGFDTRISRTSLGKDKGLKPTAKFVRRYAAREDRKSRSNLNTQE